MLNQPLPPVVNVTEPLQFREGIQLKGVRFRYQAELPDVLQDLEFDIRRGEMTG